jgi:hypothetical protein
MTFPLDKRTCDWECAVTVKLAIFTDGRPCPRSAQPQLEIGAPPRAPCRAAQWRIDEKNLHIEYRRAGLNS